MKFLSSALVLTVVVNGAVAGWFANPAYHSWHRTELERWLDDNDIRYTTSADRKDLENIVKENWNNKISSPYNDWDVDTLRKYLNEKGYQAKKGTEETRDGLIQQIKNYWHGTEDQAQEAYLSVKDWIFDSWTVVQLTSFLEKHGIPVPHPPKRENLVAAARNNYDAAAKKAGETAAYPGNWLYHTWSETDLKAWLDEHGYPVPQPTTRDKLIASVRRNAYLASKRGQGAASSVSSAASSATGNISDTVFDTWNDNRIRDWANRKNIKVPQGATRDELLALARKHKSSLTGDDLTGSAASAYGAATSKVGEQAARVTDGAKETAEDAFNSVIGTWSDSRLKAFLDARGVPVPQSGKRDEILASVRKYRHKAANPNSAWTFDNWTLENLRSYLAANGDEATKKAARKSSATRDQLVKYAQDNYASASKAGGSSFATVTSALAKATDYAKDSTFDTWTDSDIKAYLDSYGVPVPQGTKTEELKALARRQATYFRYGTSTPTGTIFARIQSGAQWLLEQVKLGAASGRKEASYQGEKAYDRVKEEGTKATHRAGEAAQQASDKIKEEL